MKKRCFGMRIMNNFYINFLKINLIKYIYSIILKKNKKNYLVIVILTKYIKEFFFFIFKNTFFIGKILNDICVIDNINKLKRFEIIYNITSIKYNYRFIIKSFLNNVFIETITNIYNSAN